MAEWSVVPAAAGHINRIANRMRAADRIEVEAFGHTPKESLRLALRGSSLAWAAIRDGQPEALFGLRTVSVIGGVGQPWLLASDRFYEGRRAMLRLAPGFIAAMQNETPILVNHVAVENDKAIRFLKWVGFAIGEDVVEVGGVEFHRFSKGE